MNSNENKPLLENLRELIRNNIRQYTMFIALIVIMTMFTILNPIFLTPKNITTLFLQTAHIAVLACGVVLVIVAGHIDLSIGAVVGLLGAVAARLEYTYGLPLPLVIIITILAGVVIGLWQGYWIAYQNVPAFIVTLAGMFVFGKGMLLWVTNYNTINVSDGFRMLGHGYVPSILGLEGINDTALIIWVAVVLLYIFFEFKKRKELKRYEFEVLPMKIFIIKLAVVIAGISAVFISLALYQGLSYSLIITCIIAAIYTFISNKTTFGRHVYAIGGNKEAARLSGIDIRRRTLMIFVSSGILAAIGAVVYTARVGSASASAGSGMELEVIASAIIGGTSTLGGEGKIVGAIVGALVMATISNGMYLLNSPDIVRYIVYGLVLLFAVWFDVKTRKR